ncbi:MAG TPA: hypothetical protein PLK94_11325 [Alphaproteobacteria bacterium]|nr:hypothetical protein [Alphaproteobacteria bacterium]
MAGHDISDHMRYLSAQDSDGIADISDDFLFCFKVTIKEKDAK